MKLLLVDGHYYVYRSFFAIQNLSNSQGQPTNAIYGFIKTLRRMVKDVNPDLAAVVWDMGMPQRRVALQPQYKQQRAEMPDLMKPQLTFIQEIVPLLGFHSLGLPDTEADDLIASYVREAERDGIDVVLATNDKDLFQLVSDHVLVYTTTKGDLADPKDTHALLGEAKVQEKWGVSPKCIADVLSLIGDTVDNIPGIDGMGPKTAAALIREHNGLENLLADLSAVKNPRLREKLQNNLAQIHQNREMVRLDEDLPLPVAVKDLAFQPRTADLVSALGWCEFKSLMTELQAEAGITPELALTADPPQPTAPKPEAQPAPTRPLVQGDLFA